MMFKFFWDAPVFVTVLIVVNTDSFVYCVSRVRFLSALVLITQQLSQRRSTSMQSLIWMTEILGGPMSSPAKSRGTISTPKCHDLNRVFMWIKNKGFVSLPLCVLLRFKATLWLSEVHPLSLAEQVTPIIDLMAISNAHFAKLRDFITLRLPPGFPVKIGEKKCHIEFIDHFISLKSSYNQNRMLFTFLKGQSTQISSHNMLTLIIDSFLYSVKHKIWYFEECW